MTTHQPARPTGSNTPNVLPFEVFADPDGSGTLRFVYSGGDGGIYELINGEVDLVEVDSTPSDWITLRPAPTGPGISRETLEGWIGPVTDDEVTRLTEVITGQLSPIREVLGDVLYALRKDDPECDECEHRIPGHGEGGLANRYHDTSCSLYDATQP